MKRLFAGILIAGVCSLAAAQTQKGHQPLKLVQTIPLPGVEGRIDHMNVDVQGKRLFMAALGNQTVEVVDLAAGKRLQSLTALLRERHHLRPDEEDDFNLRHPAEIAQAGAESQRIMTILLASIASVSLIVGGIGIMNIMLVSVTERTREIGLRLAIGANEGDVRMQFLGEATLLSLLGGALGVIIV